MGLLIRVLRLKGGLGQAALAQRLGVSQASVSRWESGRTMPEPEQARELAGLLGKLALEREALLQLHGEPERLQTSLTRALELQLPGGARGLDADIPYFADIAAGIGEAQEQRDVPREMISVPRELYARDPQCYALRVVGESMQPLIRAGDIVVISPNAALAPGCIVAAYVEPDGDVLKQYQPQPDGGLLLLPLNPAYPVLRAGGGSGREARIWGRVVLQQREL
jgi:repressor LexA